MSGSFVATFSHAETELQRISKLRMPPQWDKLLAAAPVAVFVATACLLWAAFGHRLLLGTNDEGIYLDGAQRILHGQRLYVDFFGVVAPGCFWIEAIAFRLFGVTLAAARAPVIFYFALQCTLIYWLVARHGSRTAALVTTLLFLAFQTADPSMLTAQHRWDSSTFCLASIALSLSGSRSWNVLSGFLLGCAALATPPVALVAIVTSAWRRSRAGWYLLGVSIAAVAAGIALFAMGIFPAFLAQLGWLAHNYAAVNVMPYGSIIGGYRALFDGSSVWETAVRCCIVFCIALPAILPLLGVFSACLPRLRRDLPVLVFLSLCVIALVASTYPRSDVAHLAYISALPYAMAGILAARYFPPGLCTWSAVVLSVWAVMFTWPSVDARTLQPLKTPVGEVRASVADGPAMAELLSRVRPHASLFVYPYKPLLYFLTQAENPTRFSYLQPGLMTPKDAALALLELQARPPEWILYLDLSQAEFDRVFPAGAHVDAHFHTLEQWIHANYRAIGGVSLQGYTLLGHRTQQ